MTFTISKDFEFSAAHHLEGLDPEHPCSRVHGHNYVVRLELTGPVSGPGFVYDYRALAPFKHLLDTRLDHRDLNAIMAGENPTAEHMAEWLYELAVELLDNMPDGVRVSAVSVSETPKTWATYRP